MEEVKKNNKKWSRHHNFKENYGNPKKKGSTSSEKRVRESITSGEGISTPLRLFEDNTRNRNVNEK